jgi:uncharacterized protein
LSATLLDVNVLIALHWPAHEHFEAAHRWFAARSRGARWATCPLTQLAFVRIVSNPSFSSDALSPADALGLLQRNLAHPAHEFWPDDVSLAEAVGPHAPRLLGFRELTDVYLLGLARQHRGALASFDRGLEAWTAGEDSAALLVVPTGSTPRGRR